MDGVALCSRFSIATNRLAYCGPADAEPALYDAIVTGRGSPRAREALSRFEALMPYLEAIAAANGREPLDRDVVEAYWIGNDLLAAVDRRRFEELLGALTRRGLPRSVARRLVEHLPAEPLAHHAFHVAFVGVGAVTGHVPTTVPNVEACRPAWAEVVRATGEHLYVRGPSVRADGLRLTVDGSVERALAYDPKVVPEASVGMSVAVHWSWPALRLEPEAVARLELWTRRSIAAANEALPALGVAFDAAVPEATSRR
jgi:hypothetical protein